MFSVRSIYLIKKMDRHPWSKTVYILSQNSCTDSDEVGVGWCGGREVRATCGLEFGGGVWGQGGKGN